MLELLINGWDAAEIQQQATLDASSLNTIPRTELGELKKCIPKNYWTDYTTIEKQIITRFSINPLAFYHKWRPLIGYATHNVLDCELEISIEW